MISSVFPNTHLSMLPLATKLYPLCRSLTGQGVRDTLEILQEVIPLTIHSVASGTSMLDWTVPKEWNLRRATIRNRDGEVIIDSRTHNLHVVSYSQPIHKRLPKAELLGHLHSLPDHPDWIPYRTAYYESDWGFCLTQNQLTSLPDGEYDVDIDATIADGVLNYGELYLPGESKAEILISTHICHPSMANDNLSGIVVATTLAKLLEKQPRRYSYRFLFVPGTIGSITWLATHQETIQHIRHGLVLTGIGDAGSLTYKRSRCQNAAIDFAMEQVLGMRDKPYAVRDFSPFGYDERQYDSPGFNLPVGCLMRTPHGEYPEYHTSADDLSFIHEASLVDSLQVIYGGLAYLEAGQIYRNISPFGEPQLGKRGIYQAMGQQGEEKKRLQLAILWVLSGSDGTQDLRSIAQRAKLPIELIQQAADILQEKNLLKPVDL